MKVNIYDVARVSGLSVVTVSRVINGSDKVRPYNRERVLAAIRELGYRPNASARSLAKGKTGIIGIILITLQDSFFDAVVSEINELLGKQGYYPAVAVARSLDDEGHYLIDPDRVDGLILLSPVEEESFVDEIEQNGIPYVLVDNQQPDAPLSVTVDNVHGGYIATRHLLELGHTQIAYLSGEACFLSSSDREAGYLQALEEAGLAPYEVKHGAFDIEFGYRAGQAWLAAGQLPTAVFASDDYIAVGLINALQEGGVRVPDQVSVVGFDDQMLASRLHPHLTTIRQPVRALAAHAVELLLTRLDGNEPPVFPKLEPELIIRSSTAPPAGREGRP